MRASARTPRRKTARQKVDVTKTLATITGLPIFAKTVEDTGFNPDTPLVLP